MVTPLLDDRAHAAALAPIAFYPPFVEVWEAVQHLRAIVQMGTHLTYPGGCDVMA